MVRCLLLILFSLTIQTCNNSYNRKYSERTEYQLTLLKLLKNGKHTVTYLTHEEKTAKQSEVLKKYMNAVLSNNDWYLGFYDSLLKGKKLVYETKMGISKNEFDTLLIIFNNRLFLQKGEISIKVDENKIEFKGDGKLSIFDSLIINLNDSSVIYKDYRLIITDSIAINVDSLPNNESLKSPYIYKGPLSVMSIIPIFDDRKYRLVLGHLGKSGKTYLDFRSMEPGEFNIPNNLRFSIIFD